MMRKTLDEIRKELNQLNALGDLPFSSELYKHDKKSVKFVGEGEEYEKFVKERIKFFNEVDFPYRYQEWYTRSLPIVRQLLPDRVDEFEDCYRRAKTNIKLSYNTYTVSDYLLGVQVTIGGRKVFDNFSAFIVKFRIQLSILKSAEERLEPRLKDIEAMLQSELFDTELEASSSLLKNGHVRASGALAGVTLETHLFHVINQHGIKLRKKNPSISDYNDELRAADVYDVPMWRFVQRLADIRNYCVHKKKREPTAQEVEDLIAGVKKSVAEIS